ncbi:MAG: DUF378 domain-containing protein [bacterium]
MKVVNQIACALVVVGALNWGLVGLIELNLVTTLFGSIQGLSRLIYVLVGLSGALVAYNCLKSGCSCCK